MKLLEENMILELVSNPIREYLQINFIKENRGVNEVSNPIREYLQICR